jgi:hypothetical protein
MGTPSSHPNFTLGFSQLNKPKSGFLEISPIQETPISGYVLGYPPLDVIISCQACQALASIGEKKPWRFNLKIAAFAKQKIWQYP